MLFVPRQVALAAASSPRAAAAAVAMAKEERKKEKKTKSKVDSKGHAAAAAPDTRAVVVVSVAAFLEAGGFPRTLAALQSEANLEAGAWRSSPVSLEDLVSKFLESSNSTLVVVTVGSNEQDKTTDVVAEETGKKKKKEKKGGAEAGEFESKASEPCALEKPSEAGETKEKKHKKKKKDGSSAGNAGRGEATETVNNDDQKLDGKKKSKKQEKDNDIEVRLDKAELAIKNRVEAAEKPDDDGDKSREEVPKSQNDDGERNDLGNGALDKSKKKKKKDKSAIETSERIDAGASAAEADGAKEKSASVETVKDDNEKKAKKKRKKSDPKENVQVEGKEVAEKNLLPKPDDENKSGMRIDEGDNGKPSIEDAVVGKKRKLEEVEGTNEVSNANQSLNNSFEEDNSNENSTIKPSKRLKKSSEPKTVNAFQRVKLEDVKFADERLQDNSYWAKGGADSGYGAKAQEILGQVRGRGFRHEKTKKKRGSYRGGQIDLQTHSIKFENSDDE